MISGTYGKSFKVEYEGQKTTLYFADHNIRVAEIVADMVVEFFNARDKFGKFNSHHEGCAVIREEFEELWEEVKKKRELRNDKALRKEATQLGAMAMRFINDLIKEG